MKIKNSLLLKVLTVAAGLALVLPALQAQTGTDAPKPNAGLLLPENFQATMLADNLGRTRHLVVTPNNMIYVRLARLKDGKGTLLLEQYNNTATVKSSFGDFGGTGIFLQDDYLYTSSNSEIFRYKLNKSYEVISPDAPEKIVTGLVDKGTHNTKSIMMDNKGNMYIPIGAPSNSCQVEDRKKGSPGIEDCPLLETSGGVWQFKPDKLNQTYQDGIRYATGLRNVVAVDWNAQTDQLYVMQHGRDQLHSIFPDLYTVKESAELPAECMYALNKGDDAGWPYIYYDGFRNKKMLAPEYGGDGKKEGSNKFIDPVAAYPAHTAPNGLLFYTGNQFPEKYRNGAFIAFHGSWNRAPEPQAGYYVVFQPFKNGKPSGEWEVFADGFSGSPEKTAAGKPDRRPCGLAQGPDGSLYITDDVKGAIFKVTYNPGDLAKAATPVKTAPASKAPTTNAVTGKSNAAAPASAKTTPAKPAKKPAKKPAASKTTPAPTVSKTTLEAGKLVYMQYCAACHMVDGSGVQSLNPPLSKTSYVLGTKPRLINVILKGMSQQEVDGEKYSNAMPPFNFLSDKEIADVLTYIRNDFGNKASAVTAAEVKAERGKK
ncbi:c-type cytochrome [Botryobacter ruber]|uniref:c-type cytochrome n=1 Tax=Botryobacter ruber TaxID=2171629 RepID=UPI000E0CA5AB|nr:c-type cytochrome [Botryobacter ruber]